MIYFVDLFDVSIDDVRKIVSRFINILSQSKMHIISL